MDLWSDGRTEPVVQGIDDRHANGMTLSIKTRQRKPQWLSVST